MYSAAISLVRSVELLSTTIISTVGFVELLEFIEFIGFVGFNALTLSIL